MTPAQKLHAIGELTRAADQIAMAGIRLRHPEASSREILLRLAALKYLRDLMVRAFGWDPRAAGY